MIKSNTKLEGADRRRFFRIDDDINLYYNVIDAKLVNHASHIKPNILGSCSLSKALDMLTQEAKSTLRRIETKEPEIAEYFKVLNNKMDLIAQAIMLQMSDFVEQKTRNVNLSASGLAFDNDAALNLNDYLEINMVLSSLAAVIVLHAKVVYCKPNTDLQPGKLPYLIGVDYVNIQEQDREALIQHIVRRQMQQIRESKEAVQSGTSH
ncbi:MAG: PilZ domain-containing protein [Methylococcaceae bacterium]|nr:PilZ domain-containing protein [Methylococcaceae bacterium]